MAKSQIIPLSPEKYLKEKGRTLPFYECWVSKSTNDEESGGLYQVIISRLQPSGKIALVVLLVDSYCLGVKKADYRVRFEEKDYREILRSLGETQPFVPTPLAYAHNLVYGAIDYAEELGFAPHKDFRVAEYLLDPDLITDGIDEFEFGRGGKPFYIAGPYDNANRIIATLNRTVGEGNYEYLVPIG